MGCVPFHHMGSGHRRDIERGLLTQEQSPAMIVQLKWSGDVAEKGQKVTIKAETVPPCPAVPFL